MVEEDLRHDRPRQNPLSLDDYCYLASSAVQAQLRRRHASAADAEDCEQDFLVRMLVVANLRELLDPASSEYLRAWLSRSAANHVADFQRAQARKRAAEIRMDTAVVDTFRPYEHSISDDDPMQRLLCRESLAALTSALNVLNSDQLEILSRHCKGESAAEIAAAYGRTRHAIEQCLCNIRRRLKAEAARLAGEGEDQTDLEYAPRRVDRFNP